MKEVFGRALRALAVAPLNCSLILDAGGLGPLTDMLCGRNADLAHQAVVVFSLLTKVPPSIFITAASMVDLHMGMRQHLGWMQKQSFAS